MIFANPADHAFDYMNIHTGVDCEIIYILFCF